MNRPTVVQALSLPAAALGFMMWVHLPTHLHSPNATDLAFSPLDWLPLVLLGWVVTTAGLVGLGAILGRRGPAVMNRVGTVFLATTLLLWVQTYILVWPYGALNGGQTDFLAAWHLGVRDAAVWLVGLGGAWMVGSRLALLPQLAGLVLAIAVTQVAVAFWFWPVPWNDPTMQFELDPSHRASFSSERNVLVILLDEFQADVVADVLEDDPVLKRTFDGFEFYDDTVGTHGSTVGSISAALTGEVYDNTIPFPRYLRDAYLGDSLPRELKGRGYQVDLWPWGANHVYLHPDVLSNIRPREPRRTEALVVIGQLAAFAGLPYFLKPVVYDDGRWLISWRIADDPREPERWTRAFEDRDAVLLEDMRTRLRTDAPAPTFKFLHFLGAHPPFFVDSQGELLDREVYRELDGRAVYRMKVEHKLALTARFLQELKDAGVYDSTLVVVMGDHGSGQDPTTQTLAGEAYNALGGLKVKARGTPLLMIKPHGATGELRHVDTPMALAWLPKTLLQIVDGSGEARPSDRVRRYAWYSWGWNLMKRSDWHAFERFDEYLVLGDVREDESWVYYHQHVGSEPADGCLFAGSGSQTWRRAGGTTLRTLSDEDPSIEVEVAGSGPTDVWVVGIHSVTSGSEAHPVTLVATTGAGVFRHEVVDQGGDPIPAWLVPAGAAPASGVRTLQLRAEGSTGGWEISMPAIALLAQEN